MERLKSFLSVCLSVAFAGELESASLPEPVGVPPLLETFGGCVITNQKAWEGERKPQLKRYFLEKMYGVRPAAADDPVLTFDDE